MAILILAIVLICVVSGVIVLLATWGAGYFTSTWRIDQESDREIDRRSGS